MGSGVGNVANPKLRIVLTGCFPQHPGQPVGSAPNLQCAGTILWVSVSLGVHPEQADCSAASKRGGEAERVVGELHPGKGSAEHHLEPVPPDVCPDAGALVAHSRFFRRLSLATASSLCKQQSSCQLSSALRPKSTHTSASCSHPILHPCHSSRSQPPSEIRGGEESSPENGPLGAAPHLRGPAELVHQVGIAANGHSCGGLTSWERENQGCYNHRMCHMKIKQCIQRPR